MRVGVLLVLVAQSQSQVVQLTSDTFDQLVFQGSSSSFIKFFAPWCMLRQSSAVANLPSHSPSDAWQVGTAKLWHPRGTVWGVHTTEAHPR